MLACGRLPWEEDMRPVCSMILPVKWDHMRVGLSLDFPGKIKVGLVTDSEPCAVHGLPWVLESIGGGGLWAESKLEARNRMGWPLT
jgi:hypothetical protein